MGFPYLRKLPCLIIVLRGLYSLRVQEPNYHIYIYPKPVLQLLLPKTEVPNYWVLGPSGIGGPLRKGSIMSQLWNLPSVAEAFSLHLFPVRASGCQGLFALNPKTLNPKPIPSAC